MENNSKAMRLSWVDTLRFLGIFAVYIGHFGTLAGRSYPYVFSYHVSLFFFASGFFAIPSKETDLRSYVKKSIITVIVPYFIFNIIILAVWGIAYDLSAEQLMPYVISVIFGIRNHIYPAGSLWFLPCLFLMKITYYALYKLTKKKWIVLLVSVAMMYLGRYIFPSEPSLFFNFDSMFRYIFFYALGSSLFPLINRLDYKEFSIPGKLLWWGTFAGVAILSAMIYYQRTYRLYAFLALGGVLELNRIVVPIISIVLNVYLSFLLSRFSLLADLGKNTLFLCGNEQLIRYLLPSALSILGIEMATTTPLAVYIYSFTLLVCVSYILRPIEKKLFPILDFEKTGPLWQLDNKKSDSHKDMDN